MIDEFYQSNATAMLDREGARVVRIQVPGVVYLGTAEHARAFSASLLAAAEAVEQVAGPIACASCEWVFGPDHVTSPCRHQEATQSDPGSADAASLAAHPFDPTARMIPGAEVTAKLAAITAFAEAIGLPSTMSCDEVLAIMENDRVGGGG